MSFLLGENLAARFLGGVLIRYDNDALMYSNHVCRHTNTFVRMRLKGFFKVFANATVCLRGVCAGDL